MIGQFGQSFFLGVDSRHLISCLMTRCPENLKPSLLGWNNLGIV